LRPKFRKLFKHFHRTYRREKTTCD
jgi:hypothetical protein